MHASLLLECMPKQFWFGANDRIYVLCITKTVAQAPAVCVAQLFNVFHSAKHVSMQHESKRYIRGLITGQS